MNKIFEAVGKFLKHGEKISFFANLALTIVNGLQKWVEENNPSPTKK